MHQGWLRSISGKIACTAGVLVMALAIVALSIHLNSQEGPNPVVMGGIAGAYGIFAIVRWVNHRDDPRNTPSTTPRFPDG
jgi:hypothetical protein